MNPFVSAPLSRKPFEHGQLAAANLAQPHRFDVLIGNLAANLPPNTTCMLTALGHVCSVRGHVRVRLLRDLASRPHVRRARLIKSQILAGAAIQLL